MREKIKDLSGHGLLKSSRGKELVSVGIASSSAKTPKSVLHSDTLADELFQSDLTPSGRWQDFLFDSGSRDTGTSWGTQESQEYSTQAVTWDEAAVFFKA